MNKTLQCMFAAILLCVGVVVHAAEIRGTIKTTKGEEKKGAIVWDSAAKAFGVNDGKITIQIPAADVASVSVPRPAALDAAIAQVKAGKAADAIPALQQILRDYERMGHDVTAVAWLAQAELMAGNAKKSLELCETISHDNPDALKSPDLARTYWDSLLKLRDYDKLQRVLADAVQGGSPELVVLALMRRGDVFFEKASYRDALVDGYLRVVTLYRQEKGLVAEALYKSAQCFERLNQMGQADRMRKKLMSEFPESEFAEKAKSTSPE